MGKKSRVRLGIYCLIVIVFFCMVLLRQNQITRERAKQVVSSIAQWQEKGIPVTVKKAKAEDVSEYIRLTVSLSKDNQGAGFVSKNVREKLAVGQMIYFLDNKQQLIGKVKAISNEISLETGMYSVAVTLSQPEFIDSDQRIVFVLTNIFKNSINIPNDIIDIKDNSFYVWKGNDNIARKERIEISSRDGYGAIVQSGIKPGDVLIYSGQSALSDGQRIQIINEL
ncbi:MAG: hypothetical protein KKD05_01180 [Candidatus Omnitrophica bacterium]|nr:hypothetical protein [Candidatus Omnitrophota bacterium]